MGVLSCLVACCEIVSRIKWKVARDLCKDIYELTLKEDDYTDGPVDLIDLFIPDKGIDHDPVEVFEKLYSNAEKVFRFVVFVELILVMLTIIVTRSLITIQNVVVPCQNSCGSY